jgi:hypothetical protein
MRYRKGNGKPSVAVTVTNGMSPFNARYSGTSDQPNGRRDCFASRVRSCCWRRGMKPADPIEGILVAQLIVANEGRVRVGVLAAAGIADDRTGLLLGWVLSRQCFLIAL